MSNYWNKAIDIKLRSSFSKIITFVSKYDKWYRMGMQKREESNLNITVLSQKSLSQGMETKKRENIVWKYDLFLFGKLF